MMDFSSILNVSNDTRALARVFDLLQPISEIYNNFDQWYWDTFVTGLSEGNRSAYVLMDSQAISGILLLKHDLVERKVCTLWVDPNFRRRGIASLLMSHALSIMPPGKIGLSVSDGSLGQFCNILNEFDFVLTSAHSGENYFSTRVNLAASA
jgi:ribosomal protein S18 acetylase RimI-like enzyme